MNTLVNPKSRNHLHRIPHPCPSPKGEGYVISLSLGRGTKGEGEKNCTTNGLITGLILTVFMIFGTIMLYNNSDFEGNMVIGYTVMLGAFLFVFFGIKQFRDKHNNGVITFGKAMKVGLYITLIASTMYVAAWLVEYYLFMPDFMDKYTAYELKHASPEELPKKTEEMATYYELYKNPLFVVLLTYAEVIPLGLIVSLISALVLKRKEKGHSASV